VNSASHGCGLICPFACRTMAHIHTFVVRTAVKAGMYTLPSRDTFLQGLGESGAQSQLGFVWGLKPTHDAAAELTHCMHTCCV